MSLATVAGDRTFPKRQWSLTQAQALIAAGYSEQHTSKRTGWAPEMLRARHILDASRRSGVAGGDSGRAATTTEPTGVAATRGEQPAPDACVPAVDTTFHGQAAGMNRMLTAEAIRATAELPAHALLRALKVANSGARRLGLSEDHAAVAVAVFGKFVNDPTDPGDCDRAVRVALKMARRTEFHSTQFRPDETAAGDTVDLASIEAVGRQVGTGAVGTLFPAPDRVTRTTDAVDLASIEAVGRQVGTGAVGTLFPAPDRVTRTTDADRLQAVASCLAVDDMTTALLNGIANPVPTAQRNRAGVAGILRAAGLPDKGKGGVKGRALVESVVTDLQSAGAAVNAKWSKDPRPIPVPAPVLATMVDGSATTSTGRRVAVRKFAASAPVLSLRVAPLPVPWRDNAERPGGAFATGQPVWQRTCRCPVRAAHLHSCAPVEIEGPVFDLDPEGAVNIVPTRAAPVGAHVPFIRRPRRTTRAVAAAA